MPFGFEDNGLKYDLQSNILTPISTLNSDLTSLKNRVSTAESNITTNKNDITTLKNRKSAYVFKKDITSEVVPANNTWQVVPDFQVGTDVIASSGTYIIVFDVSWKRNKTGSREIALSTTDPATRMTALSVDGMAISQYGSSSATDSIPDDVFYQRMVYPANLSKGTTFIPCIRSITPGGEVVGISRAYISVLKVE